jgi:dTDP-4-dehydrorhamnose reductase
MTQDQPVLVTGGTGQLASALAHAHGVLRVGRPVFDFDRADTIDVSRYRPPPCGQRRRVHRR